MAEIDRLLTMLKTDGGSDLHLAAGLEPRIPRVPSSGPLCRVCLSPT